ncbi:ATP-dependent DNA helicase [Trichonephila clavipes]|nr:ATP-dependent DNA helicase [Trichonephila clavipes]
MSVPVTSDGASKSAFFNAIIHSVKGLENIVVPLAWTGIAAIILEDGRTANLGIKLPVPILDSSSCCIRHNTEQRRFPKVAKLIILNKSTMIPHHALSVVDRLLRERMGLDLPFGCKVIVLGGDWRQILPVAVHVKKTTLLKICLKNSPLWNSFEQFPLIMDMRTEPHKQDFAKWLLHLGRGTLNNV